MPLYEFACARCSKSFEEIVANSATTPACPTCSERDEITCIPFGKVMVGKKERFSPPDIKSFTKPRKW
jgi:putative FmdB family regulatory protein